MKMVAGARLNRAQARILAMRPYAIKTRMVLATCASTGVESSSTSAIPANTGLSVRSASATERATTKTDSPSVVDTIRSTSGVIARKDAFVHPLLAERPENNALFLILTSDRGLCGAFNANLCRAMERESRRREGIGQNIELAIVGRKGRDYFSRRNANIFTIFKDIPDDITFDKARLISKSLIEPFLTGRVDSIHLVYNEFQSAMTQRVVFDPLLPITERFFDNDAHDAVAHHLDDFLFEPNREAVLDRLVPMYVEISVLRALLESNASEHGARMTAMDSATKNAKKMIAALTLQYNRARQAAITTELTEILGGAEALKG